MGQQHQRHWHRTGASQGLQARVAAPHAIALSAAPAVTLQSRQVVTGKQRGQLRQRLSVSDPEQAPGRRIEVGHLALRVDEQHRIGIDLDHLGQAPLVLLGLHPGGDVTGHADHFDHRPGVGFADRPARGFEPQVMAVTVADAVSHGVITVLLQRIPRPLHQAVQVMLMKQAAGQAPAQLLRPVAQQGPGRRRGVEKAPVGGVPGNQVGGVLDDQAVQPTGRGRFARGQHLGGRVAAAGEHTLILWVGDKGPDQDLCLALGLDPVDGALLFQAGAHQLPVVDRQQTRHLGQRLIAEQGQQCGVAFQRPALGIEQQARLRIVTQQR